MTAQFRNFNVAAILVAATFCASADHAIAGDVEDRYRTAGEHFTAERWQEAEAEFRKLTETTAADLGDDATAKLLVEQSRFYLGESLVRLHRPTAAIEAFESFLTASHDPDLTPIARYRLGEALYTKGHWGASRSVFTLLIDDAAATGRWPATAPRALYYLGDLALRTGDEAGAVAWFGMLTAVYPTNELYEVAALSQVDTLLHTGDRKTAWAVLRGLYEVAKPTPRASFLAAQIFEAEGNLAGVAEAYDRYLAAAAPDDSQRDFILYESAWILRKLNRPEQATARFKELLTSHPKSKFAADAGYRAAEYELSVGRHAEASKLLAAARTPADNDFRQHIHTLELQVALAANDRAAAEAALDALDWGHVVARNAYFWKGEVAYRAEDWDVAADRFAKAVEMITDKTSPWFTASVRRQIESLAQAGRWSETIAAVERSRKLLPKDSSRFELDYLGGRAHAARAEFREAREAYGLVLADARAKGTETAVLARFMIAETFFHQRDYAGALADYAPVAAQTDFAEWRAAALLQSGKCQEQLGRHAEAKQHYERLIADFTGSPYAAEAERRRAAVVQQADAAAGNVQRK